MTKKLLSVGLALGLALAGMYLIGLMHKKAQEREVTFAEGDKDVRWPQDRIPLTVCTIGDLGLYEESVDDAVPILNSYIREKLFRRGERDCDITVEMGTIEIDADNPTDEPHPFATSWLKPDNKESEAFDQVCVVVIHQPADSRKVMVAIQHEVGVHCVGLAHDPFTASLAHVNATDFSDSWPPPMTTDKDGLALRKRYGFE